MLETQPFSKYKWRHVAIIDGGERGSACRCPGRSLTRADSAITLTFPWSFGLSGVHRPAQLRLVGKVNIASMGNQAERARGLAAVGITRSGPVYWNLGAAELYEHAIRESRGE